MPYTPTTPPTANVAGPPISKSLDTFHLHSVVLATDPNDPAVTVTVHWSRGYVSNGKYIVVQPSDDTLTGSDVQAVYEAMTSGSKSLYDEVKAAVWGLLKARDLIPDGTIS